jgi:hypothetical protein
MTEGLHFENKIISRLEFLDALKIVAAYQLQIRNKKENLTPNISTKIDIEAEVSDSMFKALKYYYHDEFSLVIERSDLKNMDYNLLEKIDYDRLRHYRGMGPISLMKLKKIITSHKIINS